jgi:hypothetical protein
MLNDIINILQLLTAVAHCRDMGAGGQARSLRETVLSTRAAQCTEQTWIASRDRIKKRYSQEIIHTL